MKPASCGFYFWRGIIMRIIFSVIFAAILFLPTLTKADSQDKWSLCESDSDCVVTRSPCGIVAVHVQYLKDAKAFWREMAPKVECATAPPTDLTLFKTTCGHQKTACIKESWFGLKKEIDHESTCVSTEKKCAITQ